MSVRSRLARLELLTPAQRCIACEHWPAVRVIAPQEERGKAPAVMERYAARPNPPARCPACGWQTQVIEVRYEAAWQGAAWLTP